MIEWCFLQFYTIYVQRYNSTWYLLLVQKSKMSIGTDGLCQHEDRLFISHEIQYIIVNCFGKHNPNPMEHTFWYDHFFSTNFYQAVIENLTQLQLSHIFYGNHWYWPTLLFRHCTTPNPVWKTAKKAMLCCTCTLSKLIAVTRKLIFQTEEIMSHYSYVVWENPLLEYAINDIFDSS